MKITVTENGPYAVSGGLPLRKATIGANAAGDSVEWNRTEALELFDALQQNKAVPAGAERRRQGS